MLPIYRSTCCKNKRVIYRWFPVFSMLIQFQIAFLNRINLFVLRRIDVSNCQAIFQFCINAVLSIFDKYLPGKTYRNTHHSNSDTITVFGRKKMQPVSMEDFPFSFNTKTMISHCSHVQFVGFFVYCDGAC